uniref:UV excision repair protein RAD23 n=1 Tax=Octopus bimaculoides TaxID=37653 RepID=A0A0L8H656_OCTBM
MLITLRTLQQHMFKVEIDVNSTVKQLKKKVEEDKGKDYPAAAQKLIYSGKILEDEKKIVDYDIEESKFVVLMVTKSKPQLAKVSEGSTSQGETASAASSEKSVPATTQGASATPTSDSGSSQSSKGSQGSEADKSTADANPESQATEITSDSDDISTLATETATALAAAIDEPLSVLQSAESALVTGQDYENMVLEIMKLGFDREQVERALRVNFNNPDRAVEYLYNGGSAQDVEPGIMEEALSGSETNVTSSSTPLQSATTPSSSDNPLDFLRNQLQFQQMRRVIQRNPHVLPAILQQIGTTNPPLLQVSVHTSVFHQLMYLV